MSSLTLVRGISGCGKTTFTEQLALGGRRMLVAADDYFMVDGVYHFDASMLPKAHAWCFDEAEHGLRQGLHVIVHNTFTCRWEMEPYLRLASEAGVRTTVVSLFDGGLTDEELAERNSHSVPLEAIKAMRLRFEHDWKSGDPRPPWSRD